MVSESIRYAFRRLANSRLKNTSQGRQLSNRAKKMTFFTEAKKNELIAQQVMKIASLEERLSEHDKSNRQIHDIIYCIGGPLNDNVLRFTREQQLVFARISAEL